MRQMMQRLVDLENRVTASDAAVTVARQETREVREQADQRIRELAQQAAATAQQSATATAAVRSMSPPQARTDQNPLALVDTRVLGKPDTFHGEAVKWKDWWIIFRSYCGTISIVLAQWMAKVEEETVPQLCAILPAQL